MESIKGRLKWVITAVLCLLGLTISVPVEAAEQPHYIIGTDTTYAPFEFVDNDGEFVGIDIDLIDAISKDQEFTYEIRPLGFNAAIQALESDQVDGVIAGMGITDERRDAFDFADPYFDSGIVYAVNSDSEINSIDDLKGKTVAIKTGTAGAMVAEGMAEDVGFETVQFEDSASMYEDVRAGNSDAAVEDIPVMQYAINTGQLDFKIINEPLNATSLGMAVPKGKNQQLVEQFNAGLADLKESGEYDEIIDRYMGENAIEEQTARTGFIGQIQDNWKALLSGLGRTLLVTAVSIVVASIIGILIGLMRVSHVTILRWLSGFYIDIMRGAPMIVLAFFIYFGLPQMFNFNMSATVAGIITLSINAAGYIGEIVRGGIKAVDKGQDEASRSLGLSNGLTMRYIILPQAIKVMIPSFINQFVITMKDSSILSVIGLVELTQTGRIIIARTYQSGVIWLIIGLIYIIIITVLTKVSNRLEREWN